MNLKIFTFLLLFPWLVFSQKKQVDIEFKPFLGENYLELEKNYALKKNSVEISTLKFYVSNIQFLKKGKPVDFIQKKHFLMDFENPESLKILHKKRKNAYFDAICFEVGINRSTNLSGAMGEDLDPTNGMYWTWQSGYINFKIEGKITQNNSKKQNFIYHIGGYEKPYETLQKLTFPIKNLDKIEIKIQLDSFLDDLAVLKTTENNESG